MGGLILIGNAIAAITYSCVAGVPDSWLAWLFLSITVVGLVVFSIESEHDGGTQATPRKTP